MSSSSSVNGVQPVVAAPATTPTPVAATNEASKTNAAFAKTHPAIDTLSNWQVASLSFAILGVISVIVTAGVGFKPIPTAIVAGSIEGVALGLLGMHYATRAYTKRKAEAVQPGSLRGLVSKRSGSLQELVGTTPVPVSIPTKKQ